MSSVVSSSLSTIQQPGYDMGEQAAKIVLQEIKNVNEGISIKPQEIIIPTCLVIRESI